MSETKVTIHEIGSGTCALTQKEGEGLTVSFDDGTVRQSFLSWKAFRQLLAMKAVQARKPEVRPEAKVPVPALSGGNGNPK